MSGARGDGDRRGGDAERLEQALGITGQRLGAGAVADVESEQRGTEEESEDVLAADHDHSLCDACGPVKGTHRQGVCAGVVKLGYNRGMNVMLETPRLLLREMTEADADEVLRLSANPNVRRYIPGEPPPTNRDEALKILRELVFPQYPARLGRWACVRKEDGAFLGWCGVKHVVDAGEYDLGYRFLEEHWGRGYASEAAAAVLAYARRELAGKRVVGRAMVENRASVRVLEKIGLVYEGEERDEYGRLAVYVMK